MNAEKNIKTELNGTIIIETRNIRIDGGPFFQNKKEKQHFTSSINLFSESKKYNTYFNKKLYIHKNGEIRNAPETKDCIENINNIQNFDFIASSKELQKFWEVHKGLCDICKHCEFRYMCVDSRLPIKRNEKEWYFETECNYNPYIAKWQNEEGYKTLSECGIQSDKNGFKINRKKLNAINKEL